MQNGVLQITAQPSGNSYVSDSLLTDGNFSFLYGYVQASIRLPSGPGLWPALWLEASNHVWPPELDMFEERGDQPNSLLMTTHYIDSSGNNASNSTTFIGPDFSAGYHTIGLDWQPDRVTWYVDGVIRKVVTDPPKSPTVQCFYSIRC